MLTMPLMTPSHIWKSYLKEDISNLRLYLQLKLTENFCDLFNEIDCVSFKNVVSCQSLVGIAVHRVGRTLKQNRSQKVSIFEGISYVRVKVGNIVINFLPYSDNSLKNWAWNDSL